MSGEHGGVTSRFAAIGLGVAAALLFIGWSIASRDPVPTWELDLTLWINGGPDLLADGLWPLMQLGSLWGPTVIAVAALAWRRSALPALAVFLSGVLAWSLAKVVKGTVERGRPTDFLADITVRDGSGTGFGFVSGHTAVAFACATALAPDLGRRGRITVFVLAAGVGLARIVHGVHLPADVLGGAGLGIACGVSVRFVLERIAAARKPAAG